LENISSKDIKFKAKNHSHWRNFGGKVEIFSNYNIFCQKFFSCLLENATFCLTQFFNLGLRRRCIT